jgi:hypothetical protein
MDLCPPPSQILHAVFSLLELEISNSPILMWNMKANTNTHDLACSVGGWKYDNRRGDVAAFGRIVWDGVCHQDMVSIELN